RPTRDFPYLYQKFAGLSCRLEEFGSVEYVAADLNAINLPAAEYDAVVTWDSLHHIADLERLLEQVRGTLKPGGVFAGVDHTVATPRTHAFNQAVLPWLDDLYALITVAGIAGLYEGVNALARQYDWGVMSVDYDIAPIPGFAPFTEQVVGEMLEIIRKGLGRETLEVDRVKAASPRFEPVAEHISPFEDISAGRLMRALLDHFHAERFETICPFIEPEQHFPPYRSEEERIFQQYLAATLVLAGERAIRRGEADGQWFLFHLTPERPARIQALPLARPLQSEAFKELQAYAAHLEGEIGRKNSAIADLEARLGHLEGEIERKNRAIADLQDRLK
ncbi:MAG: methyltransferase domain-containing protein, partial [Chloroflexota bacterium]|nr:methyltransferase domain-containing protein [Chloroflexota bacterium]